MASSGIGLQLDIVEIVAENNNGLDKGDSGNPAHCIYEELWQR